MMYMKMLTVMDMYTLMGELIAQGKEDLLVLIPNWEDKDNYGDYRCIGDVRDVDVTNTCVYLCGVNAEEENRFWEEWQQ